MKIEVEKIEVGKIKKGDVIFVTVRQPIDAAYIVLIKKEFKKVFPKNKIVVVDENLSVKVKRPV